MIKYINLLILVMTTSCSTYSVSCIHNESGVSVDEDLKDGTSAKLHSSNSNRPHLVIETNKDPRPINSY